MKVGDIRWLDDDWGYKKTRSGLTGKIYYTMLFGSEQDGYAYSWSLCSKRQCLNFLKEMENW